MFVRSGAAPPREWKRDRRATEKRRRSAAVSRDSQLHDTVKNMDAYEEERRKNWEELEVTREELDTFKECMKTDGFRKLLKEYADEINDPENQKIYQSEITQLEKERGIDVTFVNPEPGYVIKTSLDGNTKCFLNIGKSERVAKPTSQPGAGTPDNGKQPGLNWSIPYILAPPRDDLDKKNTRCKVFDVVFHPDTLYLAEKNSRFRQIVNETALDGVENNFKVGEFSSFSSSLPILQTWLMRLHISFFFFSLLSIQHMQYFLF